MDPLFATGHFELWFLVIGLFFPRAVLFLDWLGLGIYPANNLSQVVNVVLWLFLPRFLIAYYIFLDIGTNNLWFWAYVVTGILGFYGESGFVHRRVIRRTEVRRNGHTTTTIEEL